MIIPRFALIYHTMIRFVFTIGALLLSINSYSQYISVKGIVTSGTINTPLLGAEVLLLHIPDSSLIQGATTAMDGRFSLDHISSGKYIFKIKFVGFNAYLRIIEVTDRTSDLGTINLKENTTTLRGVTIEGQVPASVQMGDTTEFNAGAFKTNPDANAEDLIKKLPGITTTRKGKLQAQGEDVKQVLVDGKPFFGDDPNAVLKNLPAEIIDKIQVFDKKSDQALFTGFDDDNDNKTINIITKTEYRDAHFGKLYGGEGSGDKINDNKFKTGGNINFFNNDRRISLLGMTNNINEQNFSNEDLVGVLASGSSMARSRAGKSKTRKSSSSTSKGNNSGDFLVDTQNGISKTTSAGINYLDNWADKADVSSSYFFNKSHNDMSGRLFRQFVLPSDTGLTYTENNRTSGDNTNHRYHLRMDYKMDTLNSMLFQPKLSYQTNNGNSDFSGQNFSHDTLLSSVHSLSSSGYNAMNLTSSLLLRHKFNKKGRTVSLNFTPGYNRSSGNSTLLSQNNYFIYFLDTTLTSTVNAYDQNSDLSKNKTNAGTSLVYTEPMGSKNQLQFRGEFYISKNTSEKKTYNFSHLTYEHDSLDTALTNIFTSNYISQQAGTGFKRKTEKLELLVGANYHHAELKNDRQFPLAGKLDKIFESVLPHLSIQYKFSKKQNLKVLYRASNNSPSIDQLQNVLNNTNPLQLLIGNPDLKQDYEHNVSVRYSSSLPTKSITFFAMAGGSYINNYIGNSTYIASATQYIFNIKLRRGRMLTRPVNLNDYFNIHSFVTYGLPVKLFKSNLHFHIASSYTRTPSLINDSLNYSYLPSYSAGIVLSSNVSEKLDFLISSTTSRDEVSYSLQKQLNSTYISQDSRFKIVWMFWKNFIFQTDAEHIYNRGLTIGFNKNIFVWNAALAWKFLKDNAADIRLSVFDVLKQNKSIDRTTTETYIEDSQNQVLQRYFMLVFTYKINRYTKPKETDR